MKRQKKQLTDSQYLLLQDAIEATSEEWVRDLSWTTIVAMLRDKMSREMKVKLLWS